MAAVAVIMDELFEDSEYAEPVDAFRKAGHGIVNLGLQKGKTVRGKREGTKVTIDGLAGAASPEEFDALLIPGGYSPDKLRAHDEVVSFVRDFVKSGKPVFVICHGPQLLITADVLRGRRMTGWKSIVQDIKNAGAEYVDAEVVEDGNIVSSRGPADLPAFIRASLARLR